MYDRYTQGILCEKGFHNSNNFMNMKKTIVVCMTLLLTFFLGGTKAQAKDNVSGESEITVGAVKAQIGADVESEREDTKVGISGSSSIRVRGESESGDDKGGVRIGINGSTTRGDEESSDSRDRENANLGTSTHRVFTHDDVDDDSEVREPKQIHSEEDVNMTAKAIVKSDSRVSKVELEDNSLGLEYKQRGRLFGLIPVSIAANAQVDDKGGVAIHYPWYRFLISVDSALSAKIQTAVDATLSGQSDAQISSNASLRAQLIKSVHEAMRDFFLESSGSATTTASVNSAQ